MSKYGSTSGSKADDGKKKTCCAPETCHLLCKGVYFMFYSILLAVAAYLIRVNHWFTCGTLGIHKDEVELLYCFGVLIGGFIMGLTQLIQYCTAGQENPLRCLALAALGFGLCAILFLFDYGFLGIKMSKMHFNMLLGNIIVTAAAGATAYNSAHGVWKKKESAKDGVSNCWRHVVDGALRGLCALALTAFAASVYTGMGIFTRVWWIYNGMPWPTAACFTAVFLWIGGAFVASLVYFGRSVVRCSKRDSEDVGDIHAV